MNREEQLRDALGTHHPIMRSETGPLSGCRCGQVGLGQDVIAHVVEHLSAALHPRVEDKHRCPEAVIRSKPEDVSLVISQCEREGGHDGDHRATTNHGTAEWPRIDETPLACWEKQLVYEPFEQFTCALPTGHDGPCQREGES